MTRDLVERARRGDHAAYATLAGAAISRLDATAWLMLRDADRAMDAVQSALIRAWRDLPTLRDPDRFDAWLYRLVIHACTDEVRRGRRHRFEVDISEITTNPVVADETSLIADRDQIERGFRHLGPEERAVIVLHHYLGLSLPEVASTLQLPLGTVKSRLYRGLGQMRAVLDADARSGADAREGHPA
jgi:RNA polymerase sigma-70 factor (ECF subfamily)